MGQVVKNTSAEKMLKVLPNVIPKAAEVRIAY